MFCVVIGLIAALVTVIVIGIGIFAFACEKFLQ